MLAQDYFSAPTSINSTRRDSIHRTRVGAVSCEDYRVIGSSVAMMVSM